MDNLTSLLKAYGTAAPNDDVKGKILELVQIWASGTEGRSDASYIGDTYRSLHREGFGFPPKVEMSSSMLDSSAVSTILTYLVFLVLTCEKAPRVDRLGRVYALPNSFQFHKQKTSLSELRECLRCAMFYKVYTVAAPGDNASCKGR